MFFALNKSVPYDKQLNNRYIHYKINDVPDIFFKYLRRGNIILPKDCSVSEADIRHAMVHGNISNGDFDTWKIEIIVKDKTLKFIICGEEEKAIINDVVQIIDPKYVAPKIEFHEAFTKPTKVRRVKVKREPAPPKEKVIRPPREKIPRKRGPRAPKDADWIIRQEIYTQGRIKIHTWRQLLRDNENLWSEQKYDEELRKYKAEVLRIRQIGLSLI